MAHNDQDQTLHVPSALTLLCTATAVIPTAATTASLKSSRLFAKPDHGLVTEVHTPATAVFYGACAKQESIQRVFARCRLTTEVKSTEPARYADVWAGSLRAPESVAVVADAATASVARAIVKVGGRNEKESGKEKAFRGSISRRITKAY